MTAGMACALCAKPQGDDGYMCTGCAGTLAADLAAIHGTDALHGLDTDLDILLARESRFGQQGGGKRTKGAEAPMPVDLRATEAAYVLRTALVGWVRVVREEIGSELPPDSLAAMARWLGRYTGWMRHAAYGPEAADEIRSAVALVRRAVDRPVRRVPLHVACTEITADAGAPAPCGGDLYAVLAPGLLSDGQIRCAADAEHTTTAEAWAAAAARSRRVAARLARRLTTS